MGLQGKARQYCYGEFIWNRKDTDPEIPEVQDAGERSGRLKSRAYSFNQSERLDFTLDPTELSFQVDSNKAEEVYEERLNR